MPIYSSYLYQLLDIAVFSPLKEVCGEHIEKCLQVGIHVINEYDPLNAFSGVHTKTFGPTTIYKGFKAVGLVLFNPEYVLLNLNHTKSLISLNGCGDNSGAQSSLPAQMPLELREF